MTTKTNPNIEAAKAASEAPDILIQDPLNDCAYLIPAEKLTGHAVSEGTWTTITADTVTFVIPDADIVEMAPPVNRSPDQRPDVLIQHPAAEAAYFLTFSDLQKYLVDVQGPGTIQYGISFSIPYGFELIEELSPLRRSLLQAGESGRMNYVE